VEGRRSFRSGGFCGLRTVTLNTPSKLSQLPPLQQPSHSTDHTLSFVDYLHSTSGFPHSTERLSVTQVHETKDKDKPVFNHIKEGGKGSESTGYSRRLWRAKKSVHKMVLGSDVGLVETCTLVLCGLVGRLSYRYLCKASLPEWVELNWKRELGYSPEIVYLTKGWYGFICKTPEDSARLLAQRWMIGGSSLMIKYGVWILIQKQSISSCATCGYYSLVYPYRCGMRFPWRR
jgi:hypothetical protein